MMSVVRRLAARVVTRGVVVVAIVTGLAARPRYAEGSQAYVADTSGMRLAFMLSLTRPRLTRSSSTWPCLTRLSFTDVTQGLPPSGG
jgi:hypothetical protein